MKTITHTPPHTPKNQDIQTNTKQFPSYSHISENFYLLPPFQSQEYPSNQHPRRLYDRNLRADDNKEKTKCFRISLARDKDKWGK